jgi:hypothetical protein
MAIFRISAAALLLLSQVMALPESGEHCADIAQLGTPSLDRFDYSYSMEVDDNCDYNFAFSFKHDATMPMASDPMTMCNPSVEPVSIAPDGIPYFAFRWSYETLSEDVKKVTGMDHLSIDWNPCGHPPVDKFGAPHYDIHMYRESPEFRTCMTCNMPEGAPICDPVPGSQTTEHGLAFFNVSTVVGAGTTVNVQRAITDQPINMPEGYRVGIADMVPLMGGHAWNPQQEPPSFMEWMEPIWIMGPYNGNIIDYEPMIPFAFMNGESDKVFTEILTYEEQTLTDLPSSYTIEYEAATGMITVTLKGSSADKSFCEKQDPVPVDEDSLPVLPYIGDLIEKAYPTWCIDEDENRLTDVETCEDGSPNGRFSPLYFTKQHSGADPELGGYPTNIDINYAFEFAAPYMGQACAGSPHMCSDVFDGSSINCKKCPKLNTMDDNGPYGPGHVPPHISLAAVSNAYQEGKGGDITEWFDFDSNACRILPHKLLSLIRMYYPREEDGSVYYPPPFSDLGGAYPLEFVNLAGKSCAKEGEKHSTAGNLECFEDHSGDVSLFPDYLEVGHGSPHYCTTAGKAADVNPDYCPYIFFGPNRGKYRHPHIAFSAVEVYLSNLIMPDKCNTSWDDSKYPAAVDTTVAFPYMSDVVSHGNLVDPQQPTIDDDDMWIWPGPEGTKKKPVVGFFAVDLYATESDPKSHSGHSHDNEGSSSEDMSMEEPAGVDGSAGSSNNSVAVLVSFAFAMASLLL